MLEINKLRRLYLGVQGENLAQTLAIDVRPWLVEFPGGSVTIWHKRPGDLVPTATGAVFDDDEGVIRWTPSSTDTYTAGEGEAEIRLTKNSVIKKSRAVITGISPSPTLAGVPLGSSWQDYINAVDALRAAAVAAKQAAESAASDAEAYAVGQRGGVDVEDDDPTYENNAKFYAGEAGDAAEAAEDARDKILNLQFTTNKLPQGSNPTASYNPDTGVLNLGLVDGDTAIITEETEKYQISVSGQVIPEGQWLSERPPVQQGKFLWVQRTRVWNNGNKTTKSYEAYYMPMDGNTPTISIDDEPTEGSQKLPRSGGTWSQIHAVQVNLDAALAAVGLMLYEGQLYIIPEEEEEEET